MIGSKLGLTTLWPEEIPHLLSFHCIIHQEVLCAKIVSYDNCTAIVILIRAKALNHRQFVGFLEEIETEYGDLYCIVKFDGLPEGKFWTDLLLCCHT